MANANLIDGITESGLTLGEIPTGTVNGSNTVFTLAFTPVPKSPRLHLNGLLQRHGASYDYTISGNTITFTVAPLITWIEE